MLREQFAKEAFVCSAIHHILVAVNDDLPADVMYGPSGYLQEASRGRYVLHAPGWGPLEMIASEMIAVLEPPEWTAQGKALQLRPMTVNMVPEARQALIAKPGMVAHGYLTSTTLDSEIQHRRNRFAMLSSDVTRCLDHLKSLPQLSDIDIEDRYNSADQSRSKASARWMRLVHHLGWRSNPTSLTTATRNVWLRNTGPGITFLPYDINQLRILLEHAVGPLQSAREKIAIPPDRFISTLGHDVFTESAYAIDDLLDRLLGSEQYEDTPGVDKKLRRRPTTESTIFISYSRKDTRWLNHLTQMLSPAVRNKTVCIWYDAKIKPGQDWRREIDHALESAKIGLLLVTPSFLDSEFISQQELPYLLGAAVTKGVEILWIPVEPCMHEQTELNAIQALTDPAKPLNAHRPPQRQSQLKVICGKIVEHFGAR